jgi:hypothetical protein
MLAIKELEKLGILTIVENGQYDDFVILQEATTRGGFVISQDRFKDFDHIPMLTEAIRRVLRFRFKHFPLGDIGGKKAMQDGRNKFCLGMELDMKLDPGKFYGIFLAFQLLLKKFAWPTSATARPTSTRTRMTSSTTSSWSTPSESPAPGARSAGRSSAST